jgi:hypothetical protein
LKLGSFGGSGEHDGDGREPDETEEVLRLLVVSGRHAPVLFMRAKNRSTPLRPTGKMAAALSQTTYL